MLNGRMIPLLPSSGLKQIFSTSHYLKRQQTVKNVTNRSNHQQLLHSWVVYRPIKLHSPAQHQPQVDPHTAPDAHCRPICLRMKFRSGHCFTTPTPTSLN
eukprot:PhF_6_TR26715/c0_g1_i1/m.39095